MTTSSCPRPLKARQMDPSYAFATPAPRKRRRKAAGNGAADDCFTCANRSVQCDRRRPYCTQCLGLGVQCSGYKTTLTWGVGVASRGKLRGLSWPVSGSQQAASATVADSTRQAAEAERRPAPSSFQVRSASKEATRTASKRPRLNRRPRKATAATTTDPLLHVDVTIFPSSGSSNNGISQTSTPAGSSMKSAQQSQRENKRPLPVNSAAAVLSSRHNHGRAVLFRRPKAESDHVEPLPKSPCLDRTTARPPHLRASHPAISNSDINNMCSNLTSGVQGYSLGNSWNHNSFAKSQFEALPLCPQRDTYYANSEEPEESADTTFLTQSLKEGSTPPNCSLLNANHRDANTPNQTSFIPQPMPMQLIGGTPRMQYLISYYAEVISPVIVAFDSPANPYRMFILELAKSSDTLQHAIAALSLSNLRQRKMHSGLSAGKTLPVRMSLTAHYRLAGLSCEEGLGRLGVEEQQKEELFHKAMAIKSLNAQLAHPTQRFADSVLATVLVLCLFHMCDTGVSKFQPQLAGVKKLLALRRSANRNFSSLVKWYTRMFVWFDVMTATINNRDCEFTGDYLDIVSSGNDDWAFANLAGCDGSMFKMIGQLGRLNMLSQERAKDPCSSVNEQPVATALLPPNMLHKTSLPPPFKETYNNTNPIQLHAEHTIKQPPPSTPADFDSRAEFWREWQALRQRLESWHLQLPDGYHTIGSATIASPYQYSVSSPLTPAHLSPTNLSDLSNISESFRYSALLYLERLANPNLPSSHPRIQRLVSASLHYISAVKSDVYLLWPLFVTGAECTLEDHRALIRQRCSDIQNDSGFINNLASLRVLEKIWAADSGDWKSEKQQPTSSVAMASTGMKENRSPERGGNVDTGFGDGAAVSFMPLAVPEGGEAFKWRRIMNLEGLDGEYIVV
ncbi:conserved hypothetical protein [Histoplasma capsulatum H143]|uniref:Zn(2)-C6 fungal-type domain-containing protein n=1 Tax=Ajellomyces capsulatus (strain H143) TaxID=544712 RepID=C6HF56_AJECH|nr:conserved hypothetical protein [Histoplasma capsulatum H143]